MDLLGFFQNLENYMWVWYLQEETKVNIFTKGAWNLRNFSAIFTEWGRLYAATVWAVMLLYKILQNLASSH
jgi:hypothetical protein